MHPMGWQLGAERPAFALVMALWWACQDLNLGPHPYQTYSRDAFLLVRRGRPGQWSGGSDRGCPLDTGVVRLMWHVGGTAGEDMGRTWRRSVPVHLMVELPTSVNGRVRSREHVIRSGGGQWDRRGVPCSPRQRPNGLLVLR